MSFKEAVDQGLSTAQLARQFNVSERTVRRWKRRTRLGYDIPEPDSVSYEPIPEITSDGIVIYPDVHSPLYNKELFEWAMRFQDKWGIGTAVFPGDLHDMRFCSPWVPDIGVNAEHDMFKTGKLVNAVESISDTIWIAQGNHEGWLDKAYGRQITKEMIHRIMLLSDRTHITDKHMVVLHDTNSQYPWAIGHPDEYNQVKGTVPTVIANKLWMNVVTTHEHAIYTSHSTGGQVVVASTGCLADTSKLGYLVNKMNKKPVQQMGFAVIKNGKLYNFHSEYTDFEAMIKCYP